MENEGQETEQKKSPEVIEKTPSESIESTTNCLALTIQEEHKLQALKNVFSTSVRMSWKVAITSIALAILRLFS